MQNTTSRRSNYARNFSKFLSVAPVLSNWRVSDFGKSSVLLLRGVIVFFHNEIKFSSFCNIIETNFGIDINLRMPYMYVVHSYQNLFFISSCRRFLILIVLIKLVKRLFIGFSDTALPWLFQFWPLIL